MSALADVDNIQLHDIADGDVRDDPRWRELLGHDPVKAFLAEMASKYLPDIQSSLKHPGSAGFAKLFNPHQLRDPGGENGGQWISAPGGDTDSPVRHLDRPRAWASLRDRQQRVAASASSPVTKTRGNGGFMGGTAVETHADGTTTIHKQPEDFGPVKGVKQADAEELGSLVASAVGLHAPAVHRAGPTDLHMEYMDGRHIDHDTLSPWKSPPDDVAESDQGVLLGLLDILIGNNDRHAGNYLLQDDGGIIPLDHSLSFGKHGSAGLGDFSKPFVNEAGNDWAEKIDVSPDDVAEIRTRLEGIRPDFERLDRIDWFDQMMENLDIVAERASGTRRRVA